MKKLLLLGSLLLGGIALNTKAQQQMMTPELLWQLKRLGVVAQHGQQLIYSAKSFNAADESSTVEQFQLDLVSGKSQLIKSDYKILSQTKQLWLGQKDDALFYSEDGGKTWTFLTHVIEGASNYLLSPNKQYLAYSKSVLVEANRAKDRYQDLTKSTGLVYDDLNYRHWDYWNTGEYNHPFILNIAKGIHLELLKDQPYDAPQVPFGGGEDFAWSPNSEHFIYVCKKKSGKAYAQSTNTDIYAFNVNNNEEINLTESNLGYDTHPVFSPDGTKLAYLSMARDGYESDKQDIVVIDWEKRYQLNLTRHWDETVNGFQWANNSQSILYTAPTSGTIQLFEVSVPKNLLVRSLPVIKQITKGHFDITGVLAETNTDYIVTKTDFNHAADIFAVNKKKGSLKALTQINKHIYSKVKESHSELVMVPTSDGKEMGVWVVYPPNFDKSVKYPTLLYCQGGPQSALSQFYSFRWNFHLMAAQGYIVVAPNRRGMPGWGTEWNEAISKDWGGQPMQDYLAAIDFMVQKPYVDKDRLGCVGASYGGYSVFMLAGIHNNRFKTFIAHCGLFDLRSWSGTTEELWFANWDVGGAYWDPAHAQSYVKHSPSEYVSNWNTPIMIIQGGKDYRVPLEQGQQAFQAAQLKGIKSRFLYFEDENHWVTKPHNALLWQREFFKWLKETL